MDVGLSGSEAEVRISLTLRLNLNHSSSLGNNEDQEREFVRSLQAESGAQVTVSGDNWPERNLMLSGSRDVVFKALLLIINKLQESICSALAPIVGTQPLVTLRLAVLASQYSTLFEEDGPRVRDIRERTGAEVHVSGDTNLTITMTGQPSSVSHCLKLICQNLLETLVGAPQEQDQAEASQPTLGPALHMGGQDQTAEGPTCISTGGGLYARGDPCSEGDPYTGEDPNTRGDPYTGEDPNTRGDPYTGEDPNTRGDPYTGEDPNTRGDPYTGEDPNTRGDPYTGEDPNTRGDPYTGEDPNTRGDPYTRDDPYNRGDPQAAGYPHPLPYLPGQPLPQPDSTGWQPVMFPFYRSMEQPPQTSWSGPCMMGAAEPPAMITHELMIPNHLIGSVIGIHGANISEIRRRSGAWVKIFPPVVGSSTRLVQITGTPASIMQAHYMVIWSLNNQRP